MSKEGKAGPVSETRKPRVLTLSGWVRGQGQEQCVAQKGAADGALHAGKVCLLYRKELRAEEFHCLTVQTRLLGELLVMTTVVQG